jgi:hypothetical protein
MQNIMSEVTLTNWPKHNRTYRVQASFEIRKNDLMETIRDNWTEEEIKERTALGNKAY